MVVVVVTVFADSESQTVSGVAWQKVNCDRIVTMDFR